MMKKMRNILTFLLFALIIALAGPTLADGIVCSLNDVEYDSLQEAVNAAASHGDVIVLLHSLELDGLIVASKGVTIKGTNPDAEANYTLTLKGDITASRYAELTMEDLIVQTDADKTIQAGEESLVSLVNVTMSVPVKLSSADLDVVGGTIRQPITVEAESSITLKKASVESISDGYAITAKENSLVKIDESTLSGNAGSILAENSDVTINQSTFTGNTATAVSVTGKSIIIKNSELTGNDTTNDGTVTDTKGGAIYLSGAAAELYGCIIKDNQADVGGGIYVDDGASLKVISGLLYDNKATTEAADVYASASAEMFSLPSVLASAIPVVEGVTKMRFVLDGWYEDKTGESNRWTREKAYAGSGNIYVGDTVSETGHALRAGFTAYNEIQVEKVWVDYNNFYQTRMSEVKATLQKDSMDIRFFTLDGTEGASAMVPLTPASEWKGTISPLPVADYVTGYAFSEVDAKDMAITTYLQGSAIADFKPDTWLDEEGNEHSEPSGIYTATLTNTYIIPVSVAKIWDDSNDKDKIRPSELNTQLALQGSAITVYTESPYPYNEAPQTDIIKLSKANGWYQKVFLLAGTDYSNLVVWEGEATGYTRTGGSVAFTDDGTIAASVVNHHDLNVDTSDHVSNANMVYIHYRVDKNWKGTAAGALPHPEITVILNADGEEDDRGIIPADARRSRYTFFDKAKYQDNNDNILIDYTVEEEITDSDWVKVQIPRVVTADDGTESTVLDTYWYSKDGMGRYSASYEQAVLEDGTTPLTTVNAEITNTYNLLQDRTSVKVKKVWKDHGNENETRPENLQMGLFDPTGKLVGTVELMAPENEDDIWQGGFTNLPLYDGNGKEIDYTQYVIKEAYPTYNDDGTTTWNEWVELNEAFVLTQNQIDYVYEYTDYTSEKTKNIP